MIELQHLLSLCLCFDNIPFSCCGLWAWVGIKSDFIFKHTHRPGPKTASSRLHNSIWYVYLFSLLEAIGISQKNELWGLHRSLSLFLQTLLLSAIPHTVQCAQSYAYVVVVMVALIVSDQRKKKIQHKYLALGSSSFQIWKDLLIYSDILQKDWTRLVCR